VIRRVLGVGVLAIGLAGCQQDAPKQSAPTLEEIKPKPLPVLVDAPPVADGGDREALFQVAPAAVYGERLPRDAVKVLLTGERASIDGAELAPDAVKARIGDRPVVLIPDADTFLAQAAPLLAALDDAGIPTWLVHPDVELAFPLVLRDEPRFREWLDTVDAGGKVRLIHRADGYELQTAIGKLPGGDPNGPSVPLRGGQWDIARLRSALGALKDRFPQATDSCVVPSFGMELQSTARALSAYYAKDGEPLFGELCLVYPRPEPAR